MVEDLLGNAGAIVPGPSPNGGIEFPDQGGLMIASVFANDIFDFLALAFLGVEGKLPPLHRGWFDEGLEAHFGPEGAGVELSDRILPNVEAEEVKSRLLVLVLVERVHNAAFAGFEAQSQVDEPCFSMCDQCSKVVQVFVNNDQIIGIADHSRFVAVLA